AGGLQAQVVVGRRRGAVVGDVAPAGARVAGQRVRIALQPAGDDLPRADLDHRLDWLVELQVGDVAVDGVDLGARAGAVGVILDRGGGERREPGPAVHGRELVVGWQDGLDGEFTL